MEAEDAPVNGLKRVVKLPYLVLYGLGTILGAGIYILISKVAYHANIYTPLSFLIAAGVVSFTAFVYAELSARFPRSSGEATFVDRNNNHNKQSQHFDDCHY